ncbi:MAG: hypothetical protein M3P04_11485 [Actinomycetota bacterium]|nr:hypothetical protein [Actinomycetota bacterium]
MPAPRVNLLVALCFVVGAAGCSSDDEPLRSSGTPSCSAAHTRAYLREVVVSTTHRATARLTFMNTGQQPCRLGVPLVVFDNGLGPDPAVDGTAVVSDGYRPDEVIRPNDGFAMPLVWGAAGACGGNHQLPIVKILITLPGESTPLTIPAADVKRAARDFCWIDGLTLGG